MYSSADVTSKKPFCARFLLLKLALFFLREGQNSVVDHLDSRFELRQSVDGSALLAHRQTGSGQPAGVEQIGERAAWRVSSGSPLTSG